MKKKKEKKVPLVHGVFDAGNCVLWFNLDDKRIRKMIALSQLFVFGKVMTFYSIKEVEDYFGRMGVVPNRGSKFKQVLKLLKESQKIDEKIIGSIVSNTRGENGKLKEVKSKNKRK